MRSNVDIWTIQAALGWTQHYLEQKGDEHPLLSAQWLLSAATGFSRIELYTNYDRPLSLDERDLLRGYVTRRGRGEPLQYITGEVGFRHIVVQVRQGVLIPRPETEVLVSEALSLLPPTAPFVAFESEDASGGEAWSESEASASFDREAEGTPDDALGDAFDDTQADIPREYLVADIGTGTGCIAASIAHERPDTRVIAVDCAPEAVSLARENVKRLGFDQRVSVLEGDLGVPVPEELLGSFDLVVSNPPYIPTEALSVLPHEVVDFEPSRALDGGSDGLELFRPLAHWAYRALAPGGGFAVELFESCLDAARDIAEGIGFSELRIVKDLTGRPRVLAARKPFAPHI